MCLPSLRRKFNFGGSVAPLRIVIPTRSSTAVRHQVDQRVQVLGRCLRIEAVIGHTIQDPEECQLAVRFSIWWTEPPEAEGGGDVFDACDGAVVGKRPRSVGERVRVALGNTANGGGPDVGDDRVARHFCCRLGKAAIGERRVGALDDYRPEALPMGDAPAIGVAHAAAVTIALHLERVVRFDEATFESG